jgi:hypothetical protein
MKTLSRLALALVLPFVIYGHAHAEQAQRPNTRITDAYAKRLVAKAATAKGRFHQWKVTLSPETSPGLRPAKAKPNFGSGPVIMTAAPGAENTSLIFVPSYSGTVNTMKGRGAPKGMARVTLQEEPLPLNAATP